MSKNLLTDSPHSIFASKHHSGPRRRTVRDLAAGTLWRLPGRFGIVRTLGSSYWLRSIVFHDIAEPESPFTRGMGVTITPRSFEVALRFITSYYNPVSLNDVLDGRTLPPRPVLLTFDDGYASVMKWAAPLCSRLGVPAILFLNSSFLDNRRLAPDNLVCYLCNVMGLDIINSAVRAMMGADSPRIHSMADVFSHFFPAITRSERQRFLNLLIDMAGIDEARLAEEAGLYLSRKQIAELASKGFEIGNHTATHVRCRSLTAADMFAEVEGNRAELETVSGKQVRSFSVPYGATADLTQDVVLHLKASGHQAVFLSESVANNRTADRFHLDRVSIQADRYDRLFFEVEVLPRLRALRNRFSRSGRVRMNLAPVER
ncbi:MAG TPA: polysaccharide deacetylase family protein [Terriglobales bacterium]|nr:polysaccharide deacetylase family protein [Terriglobales bacterium]